MEFEFKATEMTDSTAPIISCIDGQRVDTGEIGEDGYPIYIDNRLGFYISAQSAFFRGSQTTLETVFKDNERVRLTFVITTPETDPEGPATYNLLQIYINGIMSGAVRYSATEIFQQNSPKNITIGSSFTSVLIYNIRIYNQALNNRQVVNNFTADFDNIEDKADIYNRNQLYNEDGYISYDLALQYIPCMTMVGILPKEKSIDKKKYAYRVC